jgi:hypothetical protein
MKIKSDYEKKHDNEQKNNLEKYAGFYHQDELETVQQIHFKDNQLILKVKNLGDIRITLTQDHYFNFGNLAIGRFLLDGDKVTGMVLINIPRAPMIIWMKIPQKPICLN